MNWSNALNSSPDTTMCNGVLSCLAYSMQSSPPCLPEKSMSANIKVKAIEQVEASLSKSTALYRQIPEFETQAPGQCKQACFLLLRLSELLLNTFAAAITHSGGTELEGQYSAARDMLLGTLVDLASRWHQAGKQASSACFECFFQSHQLCVFKVKSVQSCIYACTL